MIRTIPGYENYGLDDDGRMLSKAKGEWKEIKSSRYSVRLCQNKKQYSVSKQKFIFCAINQISPHFKDTKILVAKDGTLITRVERRFIAQQTIDSRKGNPILIEKQLAILKKEESLNKYAIEYLQTNNIEPLYKELLSDRDSYLIYLQSKNKKASQDCISYNYDLACEKIFDRLKNAKVYTIIGYILKMADGFIKQDLKNYSRLKDLNLEN